MNHDEAIAELNKAFDDALKANDRRYYREIAFIWLVFCPGLIFLSIVALNLFAIVLGFGGYVIHEIVATLSQAGVTI